MAKSNQDMSSKRHFHWTTKVTNEDDTFPTLNSSNSTDQEKQENPPQVQAFKSPVPDEEEENDTATGNQEKPLQVPISKSSILDEKKGTDTATRDQEKNEKPTQVPIFKSFVQDEKKEKDTVTREPAGPPGPGLVATRKKLQNIAVSRLRSVLTALGKSPARGDGQQALGSRVVGTLFGYRRGHVHFAFQKNPSSEPAFLIELATPISGLVKEMASGLVRIALECDREMEKKPMRLLEEPLWRTNCNGKNYGFATRRECGEKDWKILKAVEPISMGAGVLPAENNGDFGAESDGEIMYMRAKFERVLGSRDSEAFYMMNPDNNGAPELSVYLLRV
ncbi:unnamed protein product [Fraxinus pennsylvanica]|uniref:Protein MIZU-KUSSEI 1 n=1 Tax=Fraxinus pennsylvanica TaxID=56036 RepID=A0AAD2EFM6_9LAMI|nr:unnamed protein product [Fraxinus pennsylvanica]